ncbi:MAG TPA: lipoyl(octanoyl) transferase LipB [Chitinophagaceae bacterium]|nr:lipoyl(octanoyl) transferase LipB [Chitinophagaceae bacterium]
MKKVIFSDLGLTAYKETWDYQEELLQHNTGIKAAARNMADNGGAGGQTIDRLLFTEHNPVYTLGKNGKPVNVLLDEATLAKKGIEYYHINRGGDITFHGPEQLVGYPILDLEHFKTDLGWYMRSLEEVIILTLADYGLKGERSAGETGVWLDAAIRGRERKICAMGIRCSRWVTMHGFALNVNTNLDYFNFIIPCGIQNKQVTSLAKEVGHTIPMAEVKQKVKRHFEEVFEAVLV